MKILLSSHLPYMSSLPWSTMRNFIRNLPGLKLFFGNELISKTNVKKSPTDTMTLYIHITLKLYVLVFICNTFSYIIWVALATILGWEDYIVKFRLSREVDVKTHFPLVSLQGSRHGKSLRTLIRTNFEKLIIAEAFLGSKRSVSNTIQDQQ